WHQGHIDRFFSRLIENLIVFEDVNPDRVYLMGYSAGGDGVFQLAPRMADRLAAAAMMAGHPNETSPLGLRNLPFNIQMGGLDAAYNRNRLAREWEQKLGDLKKSDPDGYLHQVKIYEDKGHWMDRQDAVAIPWMAEFKRNTYPTRVVWKQDDVRHDRFYWLTVDAKEIPDRAEVIATRNGQQFEIESDGIPRLAIRLNDQMCELDKPLEIQANGKPVWNKLVTRTIGVLAKTLEEYGDPANLFAAEVSLEIPQRE
ncbi:MAG: polyhydroxyalkanoate depolymerase, partial [Planctomycetota bacterium]